MNKNENTIAFNIRVLRERIKTACLHSNRNPNDIQLLLATKTVLPPRIIEAFNEGITLIGENKAQELTEKYEALQTIPHETHFIGHLQSNKIKDVIRCAHCIQSVDRFDLAKKINTRLAAQNRSIDILIQVNTSMEESKFGCPPSDAADLVEAVSQLDHLHIRGLMTIGLFSSNKDAVRACFRRLMEIRKTVIKKNIPNVSMDVMSMGMSGDLEIAIEEGSTLIRVGTAVFGSRAYPANNTQQ